MQQEPLARSAIGAERAMWDATLERGMVELRHKQILARVDVLNSMNTQAMLVAGAAVANLGGESLSTLDDDITLVQRALGFAFVLLSALTMASSLWVIVISSNLIMLSQQCVLESNSSSEVSLVDSILSQKVADVRLLYTVSIFTLLISSLLMVWINQSILNAVITTFVFYTFVAFAVRHIAGTYNEFARKTSFRPNKEDTSSGMLARLGAICRDSLLPSIVPGFLLCCRSGSTSIVDGQAGAHNSSGYSRLAEPPSAAARSGGAIDDLPSREGEEAPIAPLWQASSPSPAGKVSSPPLPKHPASLSTLAAQRRDSAPPAMPGGSLSDRSSYRTVTLGSRSLGGTSSGGGGREIIKQGWLRKAPSYRMDTREGGREASVGALPMVGQAPQQDRYFVLRADGSLSYYKAKEEFELELAARATLTLAHLEARRARDTRGALLIQLVQRNDTAAATSGEGTPGIARGIAALFGASDPRAWCIQGRDDAETKAWMREFEAVATLTASARSGLETGLATPPAPSRP